MEMARWICFQEGFALRSLRLALLFVDSFVYLSRFNRLNLGKKDMKMMDN